MLTSVTWMNDYLDPPADAAEQGDLLTRAGFPLEGEESVDGGDTRQDFEMTSNRGDCVCHVGLAREIAALSGRSLKMPLADPKPTGPDASSIIKVVNRESVLCPLYTARVIRGVKVGPSPDWLADRLRARGDIPRNNIVDATNFVLFELGQPTHVFDLATIADNTIIIRRAAQGEAFLPLGEGAQSVKLTTDDLVIADAQRAVAMAGVKGGAETAVSESTTDVLIEAATFHPVGVRNSSRRHNIASDSSYRFERGVHPAHIAAASDRLVSLILELAGGELCEATVSDGVAIPKPVIVTMRPDRCRQLLGVPVENDHMRDALGRLGFAPQLAGDVIECTVPFHRLDIIREVDLIEEVGRMYGLDNIPIAESIAIRVAPPQPTELAKHAINSALVGMGFLETVTHSLISERAAEQFMPPGMLTLALEDDRTREEPALRPSVLPSLLRVFAHNRDNGTRDARLFETAATFSKHGEQHDERRKLALLIPAADPSAAVREMRGIIERLVQLLRGPNASVEVRGEQALPWFDPCAVARCDGLMLGCYGIISPELARSFGIDEPVCAAEIGLPAMYDSYPPQTEAGVLPGFPEIARDLSVIVGESRTWQTLHDAISGLQLDHLQGIEYVTTYRGKQIGPGNKSITMRLRFRSDATTLRHEDVDPQMQRVVEHLTGELDVTVRQ